MPSLFPSMRPLPAWSVVAALAAAAPVLADVSLPAVFSDGMVLERDGAAAVWGFARPGEKVVVEGSWGGRIEAEGDARGRFMAMLPTGAAGGPFTVTVTGRNQIVIRDVLLGEVWLASGQSNMEQRMAPPSYAGVEDWELEVAAADYPAIRMFDVRNAIATAPRSDVEGRWVAMTPETARDASAVAYFFARMLHLELGVPVGIITADWGGTRIEAWLGPESLARFPQHVADLAYLRLLSDPATRQTAAASLEQGWWDGLDAPAPGGDGWRDPATDDASWSTTTLPQNFTGDLAGFDGVVYLRKRIDLPSNWDPKATAVLSLGPIDDEDDAFVNGVKVGSTHGDGRWMQPRRYQVPAGTLKPGSNVVAVRVLDNAGPGGIFGAAEDLRLEQVASNGRTLVVPLAGEWRQARGPTRASLPPRRQASIDASTLTALHFGMLRPILDYTNRGFLWYQGESNRGNAAVYDDLLAALAAEVRQGDESRLFLAVQIAPFKYGGDLGETARLREAQREATEAIPNAGLVVTMDCGDPLDIHPRRKKPVGERLARQALARTYGRDVVADGPSVESVEREGAALRVRLRDAEGLFARGNEVRQVAVAGADRRWHRALVVIDGEDLVAIAPEVPEPVAVRYLWCPACEAELFNGEGLPASPFRSDDWEGPFGGEVAPVGNESEMERLRTSEAGFVELFDGTTLAGWQIVNGAPSTWVPREGVIHCSGFPTGVLRTDRTHENFVLELEYRHLVPGGNAGLFVWSDPIPARGVPFTRSVEVQVMDGQEQDWFTSDGDVFPIHGARMTPVNGRGGDRAFPIERRSNPAPMWNHYRVECVDGRISAALNGKVVTEGFDVSPRRGFICLESEGSPVEFRRIRLKELPPASPPLAPELVASEDARPWRCLYDGVDLTGWRQDPANEGHWKVQDWILSYDGSGGDLWTAEEFGDFELICDWRLPRAPQARRLPAIGADGAEQVAADGSRVEAEVQDAGDSGIFLRGSTKSQVNIWCWPVGSGELWGYRTDGSMPAEVRAAATPSARADRPPGQWNRFHVVARGDRVTVTLNGTKVIDEARLPGMPARGPIGLQHHGDPIQFANIYVRELE